jgi:DNA polymerase III delta subunit
MSPPEISAKKNWRTDYALKVRLKEGQNFSMARLEEILEMLLEIDRDIKSGRIENELALDTLIARLCAVR